MNILELVATLFVFIGVYKIALPDIKGYYYMSIGQVCWIIFGIINAHYIFLIQSIILLIFNFYGIKCWRAKNVG